MNKNQHSYHFLILALGASLIIVYFIAKPFLEPLILAAVFAFLFQPIYQKLLNIFKKQKNLVAFLTTILAIFLVVMPIGILGTQIFKEANQLYQTLIKDNNLEIIINDLIVKIRNFFPVPVDFKPDFNQFAKQGLETLIQNLGAIFTSFIRMLFNTFVFLIAFYFFLKDGGKLKKYFVSLSPLADKDDELIISRLKSGISATIKGSLTIGFIQGVLTGIGFAIFSVPNPVLWGGIATIAAFIPGIGTTIVIFPAIIFLFIIGNTFAGIGLLLWGITAVGLIDNFLGPKLIGHGMRLHPLAVFIAVLGGIAFFGPLGFLLGPLTMSICLTLIDIYTSFRTQENKTV